MYLKIITGCVCILLSCGLSGQTRSWSEGGCVPVSDISDGDSLAYQAGEKFSFSIHYEWGAIDSDVGWANIILDTLRVNGTKAFHCMVYGRTTRLYDLFFPVRENFQSWFTYDGLKPLRFTRDTHEGKYVAKNTYVYRRDGLSDDHIMAEVYTSSDGDRSVELPLKAGDWFGRSAPSFTAPAPRPLAAGADENRPAAGGGPGELPLRGGSGRSVALPPGAVQ